MEKSIIRVLDEQTIDKIAAGEVVERPMNVVKELVENAVDAGAKSITVEIKDGGISYIRVTDDGKGIEKDQIRSAFLRHATSKISSILDLLEIRSLGFRGEALSSIAAVSQVELFTKTRDEVFGMRYCIEGSKEKVLEEAGLPDGTTFIIRNLFYNTPARKKFLKSAMTEGSYITELIERIMLSNTDIAIKYIINGQVKLQSFGNGSRKDVIYALYGKDISDNLLKLNIEEDNIKISGYIGKPQIARSNHTYEIYFVNHRYIKSSLIMRALDEAYKPYLMLHKYPFVVFDIEIPCDELDINVHPTKMEVRFLEGQRLYNYLVEGIGRALSQKEMIPDAFSQNQIQIPQIQKAPEPFEKQLRETLYSKAVDYSNLSEPNDYGSSIEKVYQKQDYTSMDFVDKNTCETASKTTYEQESLFEQKEFLSNSSVKSHKIIGQIFDTYWIVEMDNRLFLIDQHAAHEKVNYERLIKQLHNKEIAAQYINPPEIVSLSKNEEELLNSNYHSFERLGFEIDKFGGNEYSIRAIPTDLYGLSVKEYFHDLLDLLAKEHLSKDLDSVCDKIASMSCKSAIKGNHRMSELEAKSLIDELLSLDNPYNCPHGRPTIITITKYEIEKMFKRIV